MNLRRINFGLIALLLVIFGIFVWVIGRGVSLAHERTMVEQMVNNLAKDYVGIALPPPEVRRAWREQGVEGPEDFGQREDVQRLLDDAETKLRPYFRKDEVAWLTMEERLVEDWYHLAEALQEDQTPSGTDMREIEAMQPAIQDIYVNAKLQGRDEVLSSGGTLTLKDGRNIYFELTLQVVKEQSKWKLNAVRSGLMFELLDNQGW